MIPILVLAAAYLIGGIPFGYLLVRLSRGADVRTMGSGNIGATNVLRTAGRPLGVLTLLLDVGKGALAVWLAGRLTNDSTVWMSAAALSVMLGHAFSVFLRFRGGKAVATFLGAFLYLTPLPLFAVLIVFCVVVTVTHYISMGSIVAAASFPLAVYLISHPGAAVLSSAVAAAIFILWRHGSNMRRIREGNENVFRFAGSKR